jgi:cyclopropane fatty-acyl-phospholipid synthase-like methyltransferase
MTIIFSVLILLGLIAVITVFIIFFMIVPVVRGAPYVATKRAMVEAMISLAELKPGQRMVDLGSGNGRILIAFGRAGIEAHGYEINPFLVARSNYLVKKAGLEGRVFNHLGSFWRQNFSKFDCVTIYGMNHIMKALEEKLQKELRSGAKVLSNAFEFPYWKEKEKIGGVRLYIKE